jgi:hypothetical protein
MATIQEQTLKLFDELIAEGRTLPIERYVDSDEELRSNYLAWKQVVFLTSEYFLVQATHILKRWIIRLI